MTTRKPLVLVDGRIKELPTTDSIDPAIGGTLIAFKAYLSGSNQSITSNVLTKVNLNTENYDYSSSFDSSTNYRFTAPISGLYHFDGAVTVGGTSITSMGCNLYKNGAFYSGGDSILQASSSTNQRCTVSGDIPLSAGDYVELYGIAVATSPVFVQNSTLGLCFLNGHLVSSSAISNSPASAFSGYYSGAGQSLTSGTWGKVPINTEVFDTDAKFDSTTNYRFQPTIAGYYQINGNVKLTASSGLTIVNCGIYKNGTLETQGSNTAPASTTSGTSQVAKTLYLNGSTDYVELWAYAVGTSPVITGTTAASVTFSGHLIK